MSTAKRADVRQIRQELATAGGGGGGTAAVAASTSPSNSQLSRQVSALSSMIKGITNYNLDEDDLLKKSGDEMDAEKEKRKRAAQKPALTRQVSFKKGKKE